MSETNHEACHCSAHDDDHQHGPGCGHRAVAHEGHTDYVVDEHLHYPHGDHCDNHGAIPASA